MRINCQLSIVNSQLFLQTPPARGSQSEYGNPFTTFPKSIMSQKTDIQKGGKKYRAKKTLVTKPSYPLAEAAKLLTEISTVNFDATAEAHFRIGADMSQADQLVRGTVTLPHGTGKKVRIAAFVTEDFEAEAKKAGATKVGGIDLIKQVEGGMIDFDITVAMPQLMKDLGKLAKTLGPKGLMPSPKSGTVSDKPGKVIAELMKGRIEFKMDKQGIIHCPFGKLSFGETKLKENLEALVHSINDAKPAAIKGMYILSLSVNPTMGPGVRVQL